MSKKKKKKINLELTPQKEQIPSTDSWWQKTRNHKVFLFCFAFLLYANTLTHDYTQDDAIVIYDNMYTQKGIAGIPGLLTKDTFFGFFKVEGKSKLVSGGRYRPLTPVMFALEWQLFGRNPFVGHLINIILFGLLCVLLYSTLRLVLLNKFNPQYTWTIPFIAALVFAAHPIHTEVVANIKGRDEIMCLIGALAALYGSLKHHETKRIKWILLASVSFFLALLSKENAITYLAVIPVVYILFRGLSIGQGLKKIIPFVLASLVFIGIRTAVLGFDMGGTPMELMNNPFIKLQGNQYVPFSFGEKTATISYTLGKYVQLLFFPHPLTHDYYPRHIEIMNMANPKTILSIILYLALIFSFFFYWKRNKILSFCALYFLATLSIVSNIIFPIGTNMSERFMFMPSVAFCLFIAYLINKLINKKATKIMGVGLLSLFILLLSAKTFTRNFVWKDDFTLFTTDVHTSKRSAKVLNAAGGALSTTSYELPDGPKKTKNLKEAISYLKEAINIHPSYKNAYLLLGNAHYFLREYEEAIDNYDLALKLDSDYSDAATNLAIALRDAGRHHGEKLRDFASAEKYLLRSLQLSPDDYETNRLLGITYGIKQNHKNAIKYFEAALKLNPEVPQLYASLGTAYLNYGDEETAQIYFQKAEQMDPNVLNRLQK